MTISSRRSDSLLRLDRSIGKNAQQDAERQHLSRQVPAEGKRCVYDEERWRKSVQFATERRSLVESEQEFLAQIEQSLLLISRQIDEINKNHHVSKEYLSRLEEDICLIKSYLVVPAELTTGGADRRYAETHKNVPGPKNSNGPGQAPSRSNSIQSNYSLFDGYLEGATIVAQTNPNFDYRRDSILGWVQFKVFQSTGNIFNGCYAIANEALKFFGANRDQNIFSRSLFRALSLCVAVAVFFVLFLFEVNFPKNSTYAADEASPVKKGKVSQREENGVRFRILPNIEHKKKFMATDSANLNLENGAKNNTIKKSAVEIKRAENCAELEGKFSSVLCYEAAADIEPAVAAFKLAEIYEKGVVVPRDFIRAQDLYRKAADNGNVRAMVDLAYFLTVGKAGERNVNAAFEWYSKAAKLGAQDAQFSLGKFYMHGIGVDQDLAQAYKWLSLSEKGGNPQAATEIERLRNGTDSKKAIDTNELSQIFLSR